MKTAHRKIRIKKSVSNRFKITKNGKVLRVSSFNRHLRRKKTKKAIRRYKRTKLITGTMARKIKRMLGLA